ncbi:MAG TPA: hypothetical protein VNG33_00215 [Polyangiaceae bacterium]|nr:hypothetical protein [Polyangiaceae bacterium]
MSELRPYGRELLDAARRERTPNEAERARLLKSLEAAAEHARLAAAEAPRASQLGAASKIFVLVALAALIAFGVYMAGHVGVRR